MKKLKNLEERDKLNKLYGIIYKQQVISFDTEKDLPRSSQHFRTIFSIPID